MKRSGRGIVVAAALLGAAAPAGAQDAGSLFEIELMPCALGSPRSCRGARDFRSADQREPREQQAEKSHRHKLAA